MSKAISAFIPRRSFVNRNRLRLDFAALFDFGRLLPRNRFREHLSRFRESPSRNNRLAILGDSLWTHDIAQHLARH
jgi:hypothetical protein